MCKIYEVDDHVSKKAAIRHNYCRSFLINRNDTNLLLVSTKHAYRKTMKPVTPAM